MDVFYLAIILKIKKILKIIWLIEGMIKYFEDENQMEVFISFLFLSGFLI
jgi:hypothetical protein